MRKVNIANSLLAITGLVCLLALGLPGPAQAAPEHVVSVKLEFKDTATCDDTTIVFAAASCDGDEVAAELNNKMSNLGFWGSCGFSPTNDDWECIISAPSGCEGIDMEVSVLVGLNCPTNRGVVSAGPPPGPGFAGFIFDFG